MDEIKYVLDETNIYYNNGLYKKALDNYLSIINLNIHSDFIYYHISTIYFLFDNYTYALKYINKCDNLTPFLEYKYIILVKLNDIKLFEEFLNTLPNIAETQQLINYVKLNIPKYSSSIINTLLSTDNDIEYNKKCLSIYFNSNYLNNLENFYLNYGNKFDLDSYDPTNKKNQYRYFCFNYLYLIRQIKLNKILLDLPYEAVLIEFRILPHLEFLIRNSIYKLGSSWSQTIVCGNINYNFIIDICSKISPNIKVIKLDYNNITTTEYSKLLASIDFWNLFKGEKILIYQEDTCIFKTNINEFIMWDYIGAPWPDNNVYKLSVGNGGLSLRSKQTMIDVINKISISDDIPEDIYFSKNISEYKLGNIADKTSAYNFSFEVFIMLFIKS